MVHVGLRAGTAAMHRMLCFFVAGYVASAYYMKLLSIGDATIALEETGTGPPVILVHCSSASHREWLFASDILSASHRCLLPDLIGYGKSGSHLDAHGKPIHCSDADVVAALLESLDEPAHLIAHSYGGVACIEAALQVPSRVRSLFLIEPVLFRLLRAPGFEAEWRRISSLARQAMDADAKGDAHRCAALYMSYWLGRIRWWLAPARYKESVVRTVSKVAYEFGLIFHGEADAAQYTALTCPVTLVAGGRSTREAHAVVRILDSVLPDSQVVTITDAKHMMPFTHQAQVLAEIRTHLLKLGDKLT